MSSQPSLELPRFQRPAMGVPSLNATGDGVSYVGRLIHRAITDAIGEIPVLQIRARGGASKVTSAEAVRYAERIVRTQLVSRPDWWLFTHLGPARITRKLPRPVRRPYAVFLHGVEVWAPRLGPGREEVLRDAALRIANSAYTARRVENTHPDIGPVVPCPLGLFPEAPAETSHTTTHAALLASISPHSVLIVGRLDERERYKGHDILISAWPDIRARVPNAQLVVVGGGSDAERLKTRALEEGVADGVLFTGFLPDDAVAALRRKACVFAMPSVGEGFGIVYLEAMRERVPCIASSVDAAGDVVVHGETGFLVDPTDAGDVASAIVPLLEDADLRRDMGEAGFRRYEANFTYEHFRDRFLRILAQHFPAG